jgi:Lhr-like helicase
VGELDEEMVYESRVGDVFALGATSWRIEDITHDRVLVTPAPGVPGRLPFWKGDALGRPAELGQAVGAFTRELGALPKAKAEARAQQEGLDPYAAGNLVAYLHEQLESTQVLPSDQNLLVERFRDELGDWRLVLHSPYGTPVHAPWGLAINARLRERYGIDGQAVASDDGIVIRIPDTDAEPPGGEVVVFAPDRSRTSSPRRSVARRCSRPGSASAPPARSSSPAATPGDAARCGSSASAAPPCSRWRASTPRSRSSSKQSASASKTSTTCPPSSR